MSTRANILIPRGVDGLVKVVYVHWGHPGDVMPTLSGMTDAELDQKVGCNDVSAFDAIPRNLTREMPNPLNREKYLKWLETAPRIEVEVYDEGSRPDRVVDLAKSVEDGDGSVWDLHEIEVFYLHDGSEWRSWSRDDDFGGNGVKASETFLAVIRERFGKSGVRESARGRRRIFEGAGSDSFRQNTRVENCKDLLARAKGGGETLEAGPFCAAGGRVFIQDSHGNQRLAMHWDRDTGKFAPINIAELDGTDWGRALLAAGVALNRSLAEGASGRRRIFEGAGADSFRQNTRIENCKDLLTRAKSGIGDVLEAGPFYAIGVNVFMTDDDGDSRLAAFWDRNSDKFAMMAVRGMTTEWARAMKAAINGMNGSLGESASGRRRVFRNGGDGNAQA